MTKQKPDKQKMATITEVYNRIVWDTRLNRNLFIAGFRERVSDTIREKPIAQWDERGDIPWHRVRYIRCGDVVVWDREERIDAISIDKLPSFAWKSDSLAPDKADLAALLANHQVEFTPRTIYQYDREWKPALAESKSKSIESLTIASYNVLIDVHHPDRIQTKKRLPALLAELRKTDADIIALQEVTPAFIDLLLKTDWVRDYFISESAYADKVKPYGNLIMSRFPFQLVEHQFSGHKRSLIGRWKLNDKLVHLANVHLTSNHSENSVQKRTQQLATVLNYLQQQSGECTIVGDFNTRGNEQQELLNYAEFIDLWQQLHPDENGYTFDPSRNPLAMLMSLDGEPARFDRILLHHGRGSDYQIRSIELFGCEPVSDTEGEIYPSDHFGVRGVLKFTPDRSQQLDLTTIPPVYRSAIVIIPPIDICQSIQSIRQEYDSGFVRWMPHITLLYGFLPDTYFADAIALIASILAKIEPFTVTLADFQTFTHPKTSTAWLRPIVEPAEALHELQTALHQIFPQCYEQNTKTTAGFIPHLTVGQFATPSEAIAKLPPWHPRQFTVDSVALVSRQGDEPCVVRHLVGLGKIPTLAPCTGELRAIIDKLEPELTPSDKLRRETVLGIVKQACSECLGFAATLLLLGSARLGVESPDSDLDVICLIPNYVTGKKFLVRVEDCLRGLCDRSLVVIDARFPVLRLTIKGISLDLLYTQVEVTGEWQNLGSQDLKARIKNPKSIVGCWEADLMVDLVTQHVPIESFRWLLKAVRAWAKIRGIYGNSWGFLGGFSWSLLCAWSCIQYRGKDRSISALLANFFQLLSQHDWRKAISLTAVGCQYQVKLPNDRLPIITSIEPCKNTARNITRSTAIILQNEFTRGAKILTNNNAWTALFEPIDLAINSTDLLKITAASHNLQELEICCGILEGCIIALAIQLEQHDIFVRLSPKPEISENTASIMLFLNLPVGCELSLVDRLGRDFISQLKGIGNDVEVGLSFIGSVGAGLCN
jgi:poly(A) polymerase